MLLAFEANVVDPNRDIDRTSASRHKKGVAE